MAKHGFHGLSRYEQIRRDAKRRGLMNWIAVDDDTDGWPQGELARVVATDPALGIAAPGVIDCLCSRLETLTQHTADGHPSAPPVDEHKAPDESSPASTDGSSERAAEEKRIREEYSNRIITKAEALYMLGLTDPHELLLKLVEHGVPWPRVSRERAEEMARDVAQFLPPGTEGRDPSGNQAPGTEELPSGSETTRSNPMEKPDRREMEGRLLSNIKQQGAELAKLLDEVSSTWGYEDPIYRFYDGSYKVYSLQHKTVRIVDALRKL
jgi:hypothetical protein